MKKEARVRVEIFVSLKIRVVGQWVYGPAGRPRLACLIKLICYISVQFPFELFPEKMCNRDIFAALPLAWDQTRAKPKPLQIPRLISLIFPNPF